MHDRLRAGCEHAVKLFRTECLLTERDGLVAVGNVNLGRDGVKTLRYACRGTAPVDCLMTGFWLATCSFMLRRPNLALSNGELIEEERSQEGHCLFALLAVPERAHLGFAVPKRDGVARVRIVLVSREPLVPKSFHIAAQRCGLLVRGPKPSHWPGAIRPQMIRICTSDSYASWLPRTQPARSPSSRDERHTHFKTRGRVLRDLMSDQRSGSLGPLFRQLRTWRQRLWPS
jgi:hypothetical protein